MIRLKNLEKVNAAIFSLFLFQYSLLIPLMNYVSSSILVGAFGMVLLVLLLLLNVTRKVVFYNLIFALGFTIVITIKVLAFGADLTSLINIFLIAIPVLVLGLYNFNYKYFFYVSFNLARLSFLLICITPFTSNYSYMRFGYGMLLVPIFLLIRFVYFDKIDSLEMERNFAKHIKWIDIIIIVISLLEMLLYGSRGCIFAFLLFVVFERLWHNKEKPFQNVLLIIIGTITYKLLLPILDVLQKIADRFGIFSYSLMKFRRQISDGLISAISGRDRLYSEALTNIKEHPVFGGPLNIDESGGDYTHNIFLQVAQDMGIFFLALLVVFVIAVILTVFLSKATKEEKLVLIVLFSVSMGRLMVSSTLWRRPEFWMLVVFYFIVQWNKEERKQSSMTIEKGINSILL